MESGRGQREFGWLNARGPQHCIPSPELRLPPSLPDAFAAQLTSTTSWVSRTNTLATGVHRGCPPQQGVNGNPSRPALQQLTSLFLPLSHPRDDRAQEGRWQDSTKQGRSQERAMVTKIKDCLLLFKAWPGSGVLCPPEVPPSSVCSSSTRWRWRVSPEAHLWIQGRRKSSLTIHAPGTLWTAYMYI